VRVRWVKRERRGSRVDTWDKEIFDLRPATTIELVQDPGTSTKEARGLEAEN
jgi:hypothetical protein